MINSTVAKLVENLEKKKFRDKLNLFKIEGRKMVEELLSSQLQIKHIIATESWLVDHSNLNVIIADEREMSRLCNFKSNPEVLAVAEIPSVKLDKAKITDSLSIVLNGVQDPGNMGTILRLADWFGIENIICDTDCAGIYSPKCIQASMGAIFRVKVHYIDDLGLFLKEFPSNNSFNTYGTFLNGDNLYTTNLTTKGLIIMGNEGNGINPILNPYINRRLTIPTFSTSEFKTESLNVGVATAVILSEFMRRLKVKTP